MRKLSMAIVLISAANSAASGEITIAALGDSLTQGYGLPESDGLVPQLEAWLQGQGAGDITLINAGVSGDTTAGGLARAGWTLTPDVDAMIVTLGGNDLLRGIDPASSRANLDGILRTAQDAGTEVLLIGMRAPGNFGPEYKDSFDAIYPDLAGIYGTLYVPDFFAGLTGKPDEGVVDPATLGAFMQSDGIHPNREGVANIVAHIGPSVLQLADLARD